MLHSCVYLFNDVTRHTSHVTRHTVTLLHQVGAVLDLKPTFDVYLNDAWRVRKEVSSRSHQYTYTIHTACARGA
jgi:hypothetical protein